MLLDNKRMVYLFHWKGQILDNLGAQIGYVKWRMSFPRGREIWDEKSRKIGDLSQKVYLWRETYSVIDVNEQVRGKIKKKFLSLSPRYHYEDTSGEKVLIARGNYGGTEYNILDYESRELQAKILRYYKISPKDLTLEKFNLYDHDYVVYVKDPSIDRFMLLCLMTVIDGRPVTNGKIVDRLFAR